MKNNHQYEIWKKRQFASPTLSCWGCEHSIKNPGCPSTYHEPGEPAMAECDYYDETMTEKEMDLFMELYSKNALKWEVDSSECPYFKATRILFCDECGEATDLTVLEAPTNIVFERLYFCSPECKKNADEGIDKVVKDVY